MKLIARTQATDLDRSDKPGNLELSVCLEPRSSAVCLCLQTWTLRRRPFATPLLVLCDLPRPLRPGLNQAKVAIALKSQKRGAQYAEGEVSWQKCHSTFR